MAIVNVENFKPNSKVSREREAEESQRRKLEDVGGRSKAVKAPLMKRLRETFIDEDFTWQGARKFVIRDVIAPAIQNAILDSVSGVLESMFGIGIVRRGAPRNFTSIRGRTPYRDNTAVSRGNSTASVSRQENRSGVEYQMKDSKQAAEEIMIKLEALLDEYPDAGVSVADYYDAFGVSKELSVHTDNKFGWKNLDGMYIQPYAKAFRDEDTGRLITGYAVIMPPEQVL